MAAADFFTRNVNRWKDLGITSTFHRFTNPRRDKSVYFWSWCEYLLFIATIIKLNTIYDKQ